ncbi:MAG: hypothetical protein D6702_01465 [Planctomycetota bacterium]|nr:MAG: hypothetical protein D6702_01465 [Planctomycetota bacterium]
MTAGTATTSSCSRPLAALALFAALLVPPGAPPASAGAPPAQEAVGAGVGFTWRAPAGLADLAERYAGEIGRGLAEAREWTGLPPDPRPFQVEWVADRRGLARALGVGRVPEWYAAVALPDQRRLVIATEVAGSRARLLTTLRHELMHLAMADLGPPAWDRLPAWFHEGCAEVFSGEVYLGEVKVSLSWRAVVGDLERLGEYHDGFPDDTVGAAIGYALGEKFVSSFLRWYGLPALQETLARVRAGDSLDQALLAVTGAGLIDLEERMRRELVNPSGLLGDIYPQLFLGLALFAVLVLPFVRAARRRRLAELEERWAREEQTADLDPVLASGQWRQVEQEESPGEEAEPWEDWDDEEF